MLIFNCSDCPTTKEEFFSGESSECPLCASAFCKECVEKYGGVCPYCRNLDGSLVFLRGVKVGKENNHND